MTVTVMELTAVDEKNIEALSTFLAMTAKLQETSEERVICVYHVAETLVGEALAQTVKISEFPDKGAVSRYYNSWEYEALKSIRAQAFHHFQVCILADV